MPCFCLSYILFSDGVVLALLNQVKVVTQLSLLKFLPALMGEGLMASPSSSLGSHHKDASLLVPWP